MESNIPVGIFYGNGVDAQELGAILRTCGVECKISKKIEKPESFTKGLTSTEMANLRLVILDLAEQADPLFLAEEVAERCAPGTSIIALGTMNDVKLFRKLQRRGISDYVLMPAPAPILLQAIEKVLGKETARDDAHIVAFYDAHPGSGAGLLAAGVASLLSGKHGRNVLCGDTDLGSPSIGSHLGIDKAGNLSVLLQADDRLDHSLLQQALRCISDNFSILNGFEPLRHVAEHEDRTAHKLVHLLRRQYRYQIWRVAGSGALQREILNAADMVYLVVTGTLASAAAAQNILQWLEKNNPRAVTSQIFNTVSPAQPLTPSLLEQVTGRANKIVIPFKKSLGRDLASNIPLGDRKHTMASVFSELNNDILGIRTHKGKKLFGRFGL